MKIRFLIANAYAGGGTIRTTLNMANALSARHDVEIVSVLRRRDAETFPVDPRVRLRPLVDTAPSTTRRRQARTGRLAQAQSRAMEWALNRPSKLIHPQDVRHSTFNLMSDARLLQFLLTLRGGVVVATRPGLNLAVARYVRRSVVRVGQEHLHLSRHRPELRSAISKYYPKLDALATLTEDDAVAYRKLLGPDARVLAMPNAVPEMGGARATPGNDTKVVIAAGRLTKQKGFDRLIPAFAQVSSKHPDWKLRIFGGGDMQQPLQRQIDELGLGAHVELMGFSKQLPEEMASSSIYVMSSRFEGFPMVLLEAMGCGLPVISFDCTTGPSDIIEEGHDGLLVKNGDIDGLAAAIISLIEDPERRKRMGAAAHEKSQQYATSGISEEWEKLFSDLAAARGIRL